MSNNKNAVSITVKMDTGMIQQKLRELGPKLVRRGLRRALKAVGDMWVSAVKEKVPVDSSALKDSIAMRITTRMVNNKEAGMKTPVGKVEVGPRLDAPRHDDKKKSVGPGIYGMWVEFGLKVKEYAMRPFMRPVYDGTADKAVQIFADVLAEELGPAVKE